MSPKTFAVLVAVLIASPVFAAARKAPPPPPAPQRTVASFYAAYVKLRPGGIPDARARTRLRPYLSARLYDLIQEGDRAEAHYAVVTRHEEPPLIEGDLFTSLFEGATSYAVDMCTPAGETITNCAVSLTYKSNGQPGIDWTDTAVLVREGRGWRVDDISYGGTWPFAKHGRLTDLLNEAIAESQKPQD